MPNKYKPLKQCVHMRYEPLREIDSVDVVGNPYGYACELTRKRCVASKTGLFLWNNDVPSLDNTLLEECKNRKTVKEVRIDSLVRRIVEDRPVMEDM
jgi:hypothetical protein